MTDYAITYPWQGSNGRVQRRVRLIIMDAPDEVTSNEVLAWLDDTQDWDHAEPRDEWSTTVQLAEHDTPHVQWRGRSGRPEVGPAIQIRLPQALLDVIDASDGDSRAAKIREVLSAHYRA